VIDLHCHILPGVDDGPERLEDSLALAVEAAEEGIRTIVATPHLDGRHLRSAAEVGDRVHSLNGSLREERIPVEVLPGAEVALSWLGELEDGELAHATLADGPALLVESPYTGDVPLLEEQLFELQVKGYQPLLAHPERCPAFQASPARLAALVEHGVRCSITAASLAGRLGKAARQLSIDLVAHRLVHDVSTDAHDTRHRPPRLVEGFELADAELPGLAASRDWFTNVAPAAILSGDPLAPPPELTRRSRWRRLFRPRRR
jgi:protein-tyrosine phosphatase